MLITISVYIIIISLIIFKAFYKNISSSDSETEERFKLLDSLEEKDLKTTNFKKRNRFESSSSSYFSSSNSEEETKINIIKKIKNK